MTRLTASIAALAACLALPAAQRAAAQEAAAMVTVETARGPAEAPLAPATVVAYDFAAIDTLDSLGIAVAGRPDPVFLDYLADIAASAQPVGTLFEPDLEALAALAPDLVIVGGRSSEQLDAVAQVAPALDMTIPGDDLVAQALARLDAYGAIFGREAEADQVEAAFEARLDEARAAVAGQGDALILMTNGPKVSAYGAGSRFGWIHAALDLPEAYPNIDQDASHGEAVSFEFIRDADPDWLIVIDRAAAIGDEGARAQATLDNALLAETTAWREGQVIYLDPAPAYIAGGGIQALTGALDAIVAGFGASSS